LSEKVLYFSADLRHNKPIVKIAMMRARPRAQRIVCRSVQGLVSVDGVKLSWEA